MKRLPPWAKKTLGPSDKLHEVKSILRKRNLHTVCESARCPNIGECFSKPTATFMILGDVCTRTCGFCSIDKSGSPLLVDPHEPANIALAASEMRLKHVVITSVTRDDLPDGGSGQFALTIKAVKDNISGILVEVLTPDFKGEKEALSTVLEAGPDIFNHNLETVPSLYPRVRPQADYQRSLEVICSARRPGILTKSGIMVGLGETGEEVRSLLRDLKSAGCDAVTIGQYLRPTRESLEVVEYVEPEVFKEYEEYGRSIGFQHVYSGTFVRSSYNAEKLLNRISD
ncbi:MAG TPA: lipoyl synthase [Deltaproteobacteria bacterium]|nr:MAG: lipoyl synthase [Deltaproteobacteria bacterium GWA2_55_82]OGQ63878.1 MAG: lipoyl synthase [Deltaproteobacteria bacterium RIFCSPLOWO2_02_FULL_55_12]OIJ72660.1 MAG: lipoyl synthase [Deltaproteobacteria bacterium GWC2_55_46]HBG47564.1 lipoyl synthase [Deltaproteobacteria bacterium]HCY10475.1 lipoyl synthase [Deltaproteobacteria bacterium]